MITARTRPLLILTAVLLLLALPWAAMQFNTEVQWTPSDFMIASLLLGGTGLLVEVVFCSVSHRRFHIALVLVLLLLAALAMVWAELVVGVFGTMWAGS
jgi:hypothetical protein